MTNITLDTVIFGNTIYSYLKAVATFAVIFMLCYLLLTILKFIGRRLSQKHPVFALIFSAKAHFKPIFIYLPFYVTSQYLQIPPQAHIWLVRIGVFILVLGVARLALDIFKAIIDEYLKRNGNQNPLMIASINKVITVGVWISAILFVLNNIGFDTTSLLTGLGIGGMAVALAAQTILSDLFNYFTILFDKPFNIGDIVNVNGITGTVKTIGLKGTRIENENGDEVIISNTDMTKGVVRNFHVMERRRSISLLGLKYDTPVDKLQTVPQLLAEIVNSVEGTTFVRAFFKEFADSSLNIELTYFVESNAYGVFAERTHAVNMKILQEFNKRGLEFAFPSRTIYTI
ncbi:MAG: mechanosensitive ion channel family protein [Deferribacteraceae bacterium]|jgi:small-conductance mechanosensitive channel|nr:mechanosensitive ion channel family protein [Deferribacteraceae bacterium]